MKTRTLFGILLVSVIMVGAGCHGGHYSFGYRDDDHHGHGRRGRRVKAHVCTHDCHKHYWDGVRLVVLSSGHRHSHDCGHNWNGKHWVVVKKSKVKRAHRGPKKVRKSKHIHGTA